MATTTSESTSILQHFKDTKASLKELQLALQPILDYIKNNKHKDDNKLSIAEAEATIGLSLGSLKLILSRIENKDGDDDDSGVSKTREELNKFRRLIVKLKSKRKEDEEKEKKRDSNVKVEDNSNDGSETPDNSTAMANNPSNKRKNVDSSTAKNYGSTPDKENENKQKNTTPNSTNSTSKRKKKKKRNSAS